MLRKITCLYMSAYLFTTANANCPRFYHIHRRSWAKIVAASGHVEVEELYRNLFPPRFGPGPRWGAYTLQRSPIPPSWWGGGSHLPPAHHSHPPSHIHCSIPGSKLTFSTNRFHHSLLASTWTAFSDYTGPDLLCLTVFIFSYLFIFFFWVVRKTKLA